MAPVCTLVLSAAAMGRRTSPAEAVAVMALDAFVAAAVHHEWLIPGLDRHHIFPRSVHPIAGNVVVPGTSSSFSWLSRLFFQGECVMGAVLLPLLAPFIFRLSYAAATLLHEWCHMLTAIALRMAAEVPSMDGVWMIPTLLSPSNACGNVELENWLACLSPFSQLPASFRPHVSLQTWCSCAKLQDGQLQRQQQQRLEEQQQQPPWPDCCKILPVQPPGQSTCQEASCCASHQGCCILSHHLLGSWFEAAVRLSGFAFSLGLFLLSRTCRALFLDYCLVAANPYPTPVRQPGVSETWLGLWAAFAAAAAAAVQLGFLLCAVSAACTDLLQLGTKGPAIYDSSAAEPAADALAFFCGNFGMLLRRAASNARDAAVDAFHVLEEMAAISTERGGQSGGLVTLLHCGSGGSDEPDLIRGVRVRVMPAKREKLSEKLMDAFRLRVHLLKLWFALTAPLRRLFRTCFQHSSVRLSPAFQIPAPDTTAPAAGAAAAAAAAAAAGSGAAAKVQVYAGHTRFATSSIPSAGETHPHRWMRERPARVWRVNPQAHAGVQLQEDMNLEVYITHNGDFEFWNLFGRDRTHSELGPWLQVVLGCPQPAHCDSVMIAGLMDLTRTAGMWDASIRLAYHQAAVCAYEEVFEQYDDNSALHHPLPSAAVPCPEALDVMGRIADEAFAKFMEQQQQQQQQPEQHRSSTSGGRGSWGSNSSSSGRKRMKDIITGSKRAQLEEAIFDALRDPSTEAELEHRCRRVQQQLQRQRRQHHHSVGPARMAEESNQWRLLADLSDHTMMTLVQEAVDNFLENDTFTAVQKFMARAKGSFGMSVCCTLDSESIVLAALNQPLAVGFAPKLGAVLYSSECFSLTVPLLRPDESAAAAAGGVAAHTTSSGGGGDGVARVDYRLDLNENDGEILEISLGGDDEGSKHNSTWGNLKKTMWTGVEEERDLEAGEVEGAPLVDTAWSGRENGAEEAMDDDDFLQLEELQGTRLRMFNVRSQSFVAANELRRKRRLVAVNGNPFITLRGHRPTDMDLVAADLKDAPRVLERIRVDWLDDSSHNRQTAAALIAMLKDKARKVQAAADAAAAAAAATTGASAKDREADAQEEGGWHRQTPLSGAEKKEIDVLVTGVECSLWVGEQFAADLQNCFPQLRVVPVSANKVIGVMGNARGAISTAGFSLGRLVSALSPTETIVIAISQSGQTFPTQHATRILARHCPGRVFVCVGMTDSKMAEAVGQSLDPAAPFSCRVLHTHAGWRSAEPASVTVAAAHATLTELILLAARELRAEADAADTKAPAPAAAPSSKPEKSLVVGGCGVGVTWDEGGQGNSDGGSGSGSGGGRNVKRRPLGLRLSARDISDLERMRDSAVLRSVPDITGWEVDGSTRRHSGVNDELRGQGWQWALHVMETPAAWVLSAAYIMGTVVAGVPIFTAIRKGAGSGAGSAAAYVALVLDSIVYMFLPLIFALVLRLLTGRQLLARIGKRTVVVADIPYVHQCLEEYVSKLFALSFWIACVDVHGANPIDHFVHRFTHRVTRGTLLAIGRPDGRLCSQTKCESWVLMALLQARTIVSLGAGAEAVTVGHNPYTNASLIRRHLTLPSNRPKFLCEKLLGVDDVEPLKRMASRSHAVQTATEGGGGRNAFEALDKEVVGLHLCQESTVDRARQRGLAMLAHGMRDIEEADAEDPANRDAILRAMDVDVKATLAAQVALEDFTENRFLSLERLLAFQVMFHRMASAVASIPILRFDVARSQSCLRIATTAAPVSAADLEREWLDSMEDSTIYRGFHKASKPKTPRKRPSLTLSAPLSPNSPAPRTNPPSFPPSLSPSVVTSV